MLSDWLPEMPHQLPAGNESIGQYFIHFCVCVWIFFWVNVIKLLSIISLFCKDITGLFSDFYIWFSLLLNTYLSRIFFFFMYNLRKWAKLIPPHVLLRIVTKLNTLSPPVDAYFITFYWKNDPTFTISM